MALFNLLIWGGIAFVVYRKFKSKLPPNTDEQVNRPYSNSQPRSQTRTQNQPNYNNQARPQKPVQSVSKPTSASAPNSTMSYLTEKAKEQQTTGQFQAGSSGLVGKRMPDWGEAQMSDQKVKCAYCGADNLLPRGARRSNYSCYFCREKL